LSQAKAQGCPRKWTSVRADCKRCDIRMSCALYRADWDRKRKMRRRGGM